MKVEKAFVCSHSHVTKAIVEKDISMVACDICGLCAYTEDPTKEMGASSTAIPSWIGLPPLEPLNLKKDRL